MGRERDADLAKRVVATLWFPLRTMRKRARASAHISPKASAILLIKTHHSYVGNLRHVQYLFVDRLELLPICFGTNAKFHESEGGLADAVSSMDATSSSMLARRNHSQLTRDRGLHFMATEGIKKKRNTANFVCMPVLFAHCEFFFRHVSVSCSVSASP